MKCAKSDELKERERETWRKEWKWKGSRKCWKECWYKVATYTLLASEGIFLGTNLSPRLAQSTVSPLQSHSNGQERRSSSSSESMKLVEEAEFLLSRAETRQRLITATIATNWTNFTGFNNFLDMVINPKGDSSSYTVIKTAAALFTSRLSLI